MKIAYCLVGIVGSSNFGMGLGKDIDYRLAHYWNKKNIFDVNDEVDVFMHCWSVHHEKGLVDLYKPKDYIFEKQIDFGLSTIRDNAIASRWYSTAMCNKLRKNYEKQNNVKYDAAVFFRYDHVFLVPLDFSKFDMNKIWFRHRRPAGWVDGVREADNSTLGINTNTKSDVDLSTWEGRKKFNLSPNDRVYDSFIFSNSNNIDIYASTYEDLDVEHINSPHHEICLKLKRDNVWDKVDWCFFGEIETEAIRALYKNPEYVSDTFDINNFEKFEEKYVRQNEKVIGRFKITEETTENIDINKSGFNSETIQ